MASKPRAMASGAGETVPDGPRVRELRLAMGMTQEKLARMSGVDVKTVYRAEQGVAAMRIETLLDIATALEVPLDSIRRARQGAGTGSKPCNEAEAEGHGNLVLRRVARAHSYYELVRSCDRYSWSFRVDPDDETAALMGELMEITRRAVLGPEAAPDGFDERGEFSEPARVARLKSVLERLGELDVSVLANKFIHFEPGAADTAAGRSAIVVLRVVFVEGDVKRRKEFADYKEIPTMSHDDRTRVIEGVGTLDFNERGSSVMGALALALESIGEPLPYDFLMGASGQAFRLQMALPEWCPSAPYAGVGFDCIPAAARAIGRDIEWIAPEPGAPDPMRRRVEAIVESIDRGVPALYGAEECGLIVGYHHGGKQFSLRTYFDPSELYTVLDRLDWPSPGILAAESTPVDRRDVLRRSLELACELAHCEERYPTHHPGRHYVCGFAAWDSWIRGLVDEERFAGRGADDLVVPIQANSWCYLSLLDARRAAASYLHGFAAETGGAVAKRISKAADLYDEMVTRLEGGRVQVPHPHVEANDDNVGLAYRLRGTSPWSLEMRATQAETLRDCLALERSSVGELGAVAAEL